MSAFALSLALASCSPSRRAAQTPEAAPPPAHAANLAPEPTAPAETAAPSPAVARPAEPPAKKPRRPAPAHMAPPKNKAPVPKKFAVEARGFFGPWRGQSPGSAMITKVDFKPDGSFYSNCSYYGLIGVANTKGKWEIRDRALVWYYAHAGVETEDINPILEFSPDRFTIREMSGELTTFTRLP